MLLIALGLASALTFFYYGTACWIAERLRLEYLRYGVPRLRVILGTLQLLGATGILVGFFVHPIGAAAALGLALMMGIGVVFRWRLGDEFRLMVPATTLTLLNSVLVVLFVTA